MSALSDETVQLLACLAAFLLYVLMVPVLIWVGKLAGLAVPLKAGLEAFWQDWRASRGVVGRVGVVIAHAPTALRLIFGGGIVTTIMGGFGCLAAICGSWVPGLRLFLDFLRWVLEWVERNVLSAAQPRPPVRPRPPA